MILILLVGCSGSGNQSLLSVQDPQESPDAGVVQLALKAVQAGTTYKVTLLSPAASGLYQIAGSLEYDSQRYSLLSVEPGGGLGDADDTYFAWGEPWTGSIDFAYTRRFHGPGVEGQAGLVVFTVDAPDGFSATDFRLDTAPGSLVVRDSSKQAMEARLTGVSQ